jgi:hypothetical protein
VYVWNTTFFMKYRHGFSDRRRVLDWQLDLLLSYTQVQYNWVSPDSLSLTTHEWIYHNNSAFIVTAATLVTGELQVPFLPFLGHQPTNSLTHLTHTTTPTTPTHNWELRGIWPLVGL